LSYIREPRRRPKPDFSLTIVNIVFLLLLFYLTAGTLVSQSEFEAAAPVTADLPLDRLPRPLLVVGTNGLFIDGRAIGRKALAAAVDEAMDAKAGFLNVLAEKDMPAGEFLDIVGEAGLADIPIRIVTLRDRGPNQAGP
jgi:biopolymer transport protein ExbD